MNETFSKYKCLRFVSERKILSKINFQIIQQSVMYRKLLYKIDMRLSSFNFNLLFTLI